MNRSLLVALIFLFCVAVPLAWFAWQYFWKPGRLAFSLVTYGVSSASILIFAWAAQAPRAWVAIAFLCLVLGALRMHLLFPLQMWAVRRRAARASVDGPVPDPPHRADGERHD